MFESCVQQFLNAAALILGKLQVSGHAIISEGEQPIVFDEDASQLCRLLFRQQPDRLLLKLLTGVFDGVLNLLPDGRALFVTGRCPEFFLELFKDLACGGAVAAQLVNLIDHLGGNANFLQDRFIAQHVQFCPASATLRQR